MCWMSAATAERFVLMEFLTTISFSCGIHAFRCHLVVDNVHSYSRMPAEPTKFVGSWQHVDYLLSLNICIEQFDKYVLAALSFEDLCSSVAGVHVHRAIRIYRLYRRSTATNIHRYGLSLSLFGPKKNCGGEKIADKS